MDRQEFIEKMKTASGDHFPLVVDRITDEAIKRWDAKYPQYEHGHMVSVVAMEELGECIQAISRRMRGRTKDNYEILEEMADVFIDLMCVSKIYGISRSEINKAINVKLEREDDRIELWKQGIETP